MFSWFDCCINVLRGFLFGWVERSVVEGWILCLWRVGVGWDLGEWVSRVGMSLNLGFFGGFCDSVGGGGWLWVCLLMGVGGRLRVVSVGGGGAGGAVGFGVGWVRVLRLTWGLGSC